MNENNSNNGSADDDVYEIEDTGASVDEIEKEMENAAKEAAGEPTAAPAPEPEPAGNDAKEMKDRYLRTLADFENFRKRTEREKNDFFKYALAGTIRELLPVLDNFDRALEHAEEGDEFHKGVLMIYRQLASVLEKAGVKVIDESGVHFNPNLHEAVVSEQDPSVPSHTVVAILQKGYILHDRLIRPAMVKVAVGGPEPEAAQA
jgi:molecular chaperone GrpE